MNILMVPGMILGILTLVGLIFLAIGLIRRLMTRGWVSTTGQVISSQRGIPGLPAMYPTFRWQDDTGREHRHTSMVRSTLGPSPGQLIAVKYDPDNPSRGMIDSMVQSGLIFTIIGATLTAGGVLGGVYVLVVVSQLS